MNDMMHDDPASRPTARQVEQRFRAIKASLSQRTLRRSPGLVRGYDALEYILGNIPSRVPRSLSDVFLKVLGKPSTNPPPRKLPPRRFGYLTANPDQSRASV